MRGSSLTVDTVIPYLIERNLVSVASIVEGDLEVIDAGRRNQNLKIVRRRGPSYLIKPAKVKVPRTRRFAVKRRSTSIASWIPVPLISVRTCLPSTAGTRIVAY